MWYFPISALSKVKKGKEKVVKSKEIQSTVHEKY